MENFAQNYVKLDIFVQKGVNPKSLVAALLLGMKALNCFCSKPPHLPHLDVDGVLVLLDKLRGRGALEVLGPGGGLGQEEAPTRG